MNMSKYQNGVFLAPMAGVTDYAFRTICNEYKVDGTFSEMVSAKGIYYKDRKTHLLTKCAPSDDSFAIQLFGSNPEIMGYAANEMSNRKDVAWIDVNMGCPAPKITKNGDGSALMKDIKLAESVLKSVIENSIKPVSLKIRLGWDDNCINCLDFAQMAKEVGVSMLAVHGRTKKQMYQGKANWEPILEIKEKVDIFLIGNGDIVDVDSYKRFTEYSGVDAVMIGRGAMGNPFIFEQIYRYKKGLLQRNIDVKEKERTILSQFEYMVKDRGEQKAVLEMRKHLAWYVKGLHGGAKFKNKLFKVTTLDEIYVMINMYFNALSEVAYEK